MSSPVALNNISNECSETGPAAANKPPGNSSFQWAAPDSNLVNLATSLLFIVQESKVLKLHSGFKEWTLQ